MKKISEKTRKKLSQALMGNKNALGFRHSEKTKKRISMIKKGKKPYIMTEKTKKKMKLNAAKYWLGKKRPPFSEEWKKKIAKAKRGTIVSEKTRRKISLSHKGKIPKNLSFIHSFNVGENHYRWNPNREEVKKNKRNDPEYKQWIKKIKKRDNWKCRINNQDCSGYCIAHHILSWSDYPELRYEINNGITLCQAHHPRKRAEEKRLIPFFQGLVLVSN